MTFSVVDSLVCIKESLSSPRSPKYLALLIKFRDMLAKNERYAELP